MSQIDVDQALNFLASYPSGSYTLDRDDAKKLLLTSGGTIIARGALYNVLCLEIGAGVCKLTLERAHP